MSAALNGFYQDVHRSVAGGTPLDARIRIDELLAADYETAMRAFPVR